MNIRNKRWLSVFTLLICGMLVATGIEAKKPVGEKPDNPKKTKAECILFTGDLLGMANVEGCCPNAGPFPAYTMTLDLHDEGGNDLNDVHGIPYGETAFDGHLFMNFAPGGYLVQFWNWEDDEIPGFGNIFFEIYGGDIIYDRKSNFLNVTFEDALPTLWLYPDGWDPDGNEGDGCCAIKAPVGLVGFELVKTSGLTLCDE